MSTLDIAVRWSVWCIFFIVLYWMLPPPVISQTIGSRQIEETVDRSRSLESKWKEAYAWIPTLEPYKGYDTWKVMDVKDRSNPKWFNPETKEKHELRDDVGNVEWEWELDPNAQLWARKEAEEQAKQGRMGHLLGTAPCIQQTLAGGTSGVGKWYTTRVPTCEARMGVFEIKEIVRDGDGVGRMVVKRKVRAILVADAVAYSPKTKQCYRSRHWRYEYVE